jgi:hypothetical protein
VTVKLVQLLIYIHVCVCVCVSEWVSEWVSLVIRRLTSSRVQMFQHFIECMNYELRAGTYSAQNVEERQRAHCTAASQFPLSFDPLLPAVRPARTLHSENIGASKQITYCLQHTNNRKPTEPADCIRGKWIRLIQEPYTRRTPFYRNMTCLPDVHINVTFESLNGQYQSIIHNIL